MILKENEFLKEIVEKVVLIVIEDPESRLPDKLDSFPVILSQLYALLSVNDDIEYRINILGVDKMKWNTFCDLTEDECNRRAMKHVNFTFGCKEIEEIFGISFSELMNESLEKYSDECLETYEYESPIFKKILLPEHVMKKATTLFMKAHCDPNIETNIAKWITNTFNDNSRKLFLKRVIFLLDSISTLVGFQKRDIFNDRPFVLMARLIRSAHYKNTSDYRDAIVKNYGVTKPFLFGSAFDYLENLIIEELKENWQKKTSEIVTKYENSKIARVAKKFVQASSMEQAVSYAKGLNHGFDIRDFWTPLTFKNHGHPLALEKIKFLHCGIFQGERYLYNNIEISEWKPTKKNAHAFFRVNYETTPDLDLWKSILVSDGIVENRHIDIWHKIHFENPQEKKISR